MRYLARVVKIFYASDFGDKVVKHISLNFYLLYLKLIAYEF